MNGYQELWWQHAKSDHDVFELLRVEGVVQCYSLHYLQMATEKIAKAYLWQSGSPSPKSHAGFVRFLRFLAHTQRQRHSQRIAALFSFSRFSDFKHRIRTVLPIAHSLERLTPDLANDGPNPEYPWPHAGPKFAPVNYEFAVWTTLNSPVGRDLLRIIHVAVDRFAEYADA